MITVLSLEELQKFPNFRIHEIEIDWIKKAVMFHPMFIIKDDDKVGRRNFYPIEPIKKKKKSEPKEESEKGNEDEEIVELDAYTFTSKCTKELVSLKVKYPHVMKFANISYEEVLIGNKHYFSAIVELISYENNEYNIKFKSKYTSKKKHATRIAEIQLYYLLDYHNGKRNVPFESVESQYIKLVGEEDSIEEENPNSIKNELVLKKSRLVLLEKFYSWLNDRNLFEEANNCASDLTDAMKYIGKKTSEININSFIDNLKEMNIYDDVLEYEAANNINLVDHMLSINNDDSSIQQSIQTNELKVVYLSIIRIGKFNENQDFICEWASRNTTEVHYSMMPFIFKIMFTRHNITYSIKNILKCVVGPIHCEFDMNRALCFFKFKLSRSPVILERGLYNELYTRSLDFTTNNAWNSATTLIIEFSLEANHIEIMYLIKKLTEYGLLIPKKVDKLSFNIIETYHSNYKVPENISDLSFFVRFKIQCLVSKRIIIREAVKYEWIELLKTLPDHIAFALLQAIETKNSLGTSLMKETNDILKSFKCKDTLNRFLTHDQYCFIPHCIITPLRIICEGPIAELSNRVVRHFAKFRNNFIRVSFKEEDIRSNVKNLGKKTARDRILNILNDGFYLEFIDKKYEFLVFSAGQLRAHKAWFFSPTKDDDGKIIDANYIRSWLGNFNNIYNVARYASRLGQAFSSTYPTFDVPKEWIIPIDDIVRNNYIFSDGCGTCSKEIAIMAAKELKLSYVPSVFQIRIGGIKGCLSVDPRLEGYKICVRPSMDKFPCDYTHFEVITWSKPIPAHLNKQIIQILSSRGVKNEAFLNLQKEALEKLITPFKSDHFDTKKIISVLERTWRVKNNKNSIPARAIAMLESGFTLNEPYLNSLIQTINFKRYKELVVMARIPITHGQYAIGIVDEFGILEPGQIFYRMSLGNGHYKTIKGEVIISRSPSLHPADIRITEAVDIKELYHYVDCLVFSSKGDRPLFNECSGGDLDGDQYLIIWDKNFIPKDGNIDPPIYETSRDASRSKDDNPVSLNEVKQYFTEYILNDRLGEIADAHVYYCDKSPKGVFDEKCITLAEYHRIAVDAPKTGKMIPSIKEFAVPEWPDFMEKSSSKVYLSDKILGILYRNADEKNAYFYVQNQKVSLLTIQIDYDLIIEGYQIFVNEAKELRNNYVLELDVLMNLYSLNSESYIVTGDVFWKSGKDRKEWQGQREILDMCLNKLKGVYRSKFFEGLDEKDKYKKASAWYVVTYDPKYYDDFKNEEYEVKISFPWIVDDILCEIKKGALKLQNELEESDSTVEYNHKEALSIQD